MAKHKMIWGVYDNAHGVFIDNFMGDNTLFMFAAAKEYGREHLLKIIFNGTLVGALFDDEDSADKTYDLLVDVYKIQKSEGAEVIMESGKYVFDVNSLIVIQKEVEEKKHFKIAKRGEEDADSN